MKSLLTKICAVLMIAITVIASNSTKALAATYAGTVTSYKCYGGFESTATYGAEWKLEKIESKFNYYSYVPAKIVWYTPTQVKEMYEAKATVGSVAKLKEIGAVVVDLAKAKGIEVAKEWIEARYTKVVASKLLKAFAAFAWLDAAYTVIDLMGDYATLSIMESAINKNTGLIYYSVTLKVGGATTSGWHNWDGKAGLGTYPNICIPTNSCNFYGTYIAPIDLDYLGSFC